VQKNTVLVVGGAGYIGSHMVKMLAKEGHQVVVLDNLSTGHAVAAGFADVFIEGDLADQQLLDKIFTDYNFDAVMHFAAFSIVGESVSNPAKYYRNNVSNTLNLLDAMVEHQVLSFVFSSTAAVFGEPEYTPIDEEHPKNPINPYGKSKLMVERILEDYATAYGLNSVSLRYFNAAGADPDGDLGEMHEPETHLIPLILQAASGRRENIKIFGTDYPTPDGTCVRDYVHIVDLCDAHRLAMHQLLADKLKGVEVLNLGNGDGFSVKEVIDCAQTVITEENKSINAVEVSKRAGDPVILLADSTKAKKTLDWQPQFNKLNLIISHAWKWETKIR
jgi:UDP-glucose 4-epimerase